MPFLLSKHTVVVESRGRRVPIYLSRPTVPDKRPVIIVVHEWWGLNDHIRSIADRYAAMGYVAAAPDLYGEAPLPKDVNAARKLAGSVTPELSSEILKSVVDYISIRDFASSKLGFHGYCFGGTHVFNYVCEAKKRIAAAAVFYASVLPSKEKLASETVPLLIVYGDKDQLVKIDQVHELEKTLKELNKKAQFEIYPGAGHAFSNDSGPNYNEAAAKDAWEKVISFFGTYMPLPRTPTS